MKGALIRLHLAVFLWGFTGVLGKTISLNEAWLVWWRLLITAISLWLLFFFKKQITKISFKDFIRITFIGSVLALHWLCFYGSIKSSNVSIALTCLSTTGLFAAIIEPIFLRKKINISEIFLGFFALAGIAIIYFSNLKFSIGIGIGLLSAIFTVLVSVMNKKMIGDYEPQTITLYQLTGGFIGLSLMMPFYNHIFPTKEIFPQHWDWLWLVILSWCCTIFTFMLYISALKKVSAFTMNLTLTLEPVYGIILAFIIYHENQYFNYTFYIGFGLILLAVLLQMRRVIKQKQAVVFE
jgi:drug/metabolite transporter (DMT)-like permease